MKTQKMFVLNIMLLLIMNNLLADSKATNISSDSSDNNSENGKIIEWHIGVLEGKNYFEDEAQSVRILSDMKAKRAKNLLISKFKTSKNKELRRAIGRYMFDFAENENDMKEMEQILLSEVRKYESKNNRFQGNRTNISKDSVEYEALCSLAREGNREIIPVVRRWLVEGGVDVYSCFKSTDKVLLSADLNSVFHKVDKDVQKRIVLTSIITLGKDIKDYNDFLTDLLNSQNEYDQDIAREVITIVWDKFSATGKREKVREDVELLKNDLKSFDEESRKIFDRINKEKK